MSKRLAVLLAVVLCHAAHAGEPAPFRWPGGARAAISLSYDDALPSQLDNVLPALNARGLKATFYLTLANDAVAQRLAEWRHAATQGHELGNHTLFHPCSRAAPGREWVAPHRNLDTISVEAMRQEVLLANTFLYAIDGQTERTYTAPCVDLLAGGKPYLPAIRSAFVGIKSHLGGVAPDMASFDRYDVGSAMPAGLNGEQLIAIVQQAAARGSFASITFHGVGGDYLSVSNEAHEALLNHLADNRAIYWVDSFVNITRHLRAVQAR